MRDSRWQLLILVLAALFHPGLEAGLSPWGLSPDLPFLLVFWIAIRRHRHTATLWGFALGLFVDLADFSHLGGAALSFTVAAWMISTLAAHIDRESLALRLFLLFIGQVTAHTILLLVQTGTAPGSAILLWFVSVLPGALLGCLLYLASLALVLLGHGAWRMLHEPLGGR